MSFWSAALDAFFPPTCPGCGRSHPPLFCSDCLHRIPEPEPPICEVCGLTLPRQSPTPRCNSCLVHPPAFRRARACSTYQVAGGQESGPLRTVLHRYKYGRDLSQTAALRALVAERCPLDLRGYDVAIPVPLHLSRLRWRGFNQAQLLFDPIARGYGLPLDPFAIERVRPTDPQVRLPATVRRRNVRNAFRATPHCDVDGRRVLLVDDVFTSGATVDACAATLMRAGAALVDVLTLAHVPLP